MTSLENSSKKPADAKTQTKMFAKIAVLTIVLFAVVYSQDSNNGHAEQMKMFDNFLTGLDLALDKKEEVLAGLLKEISRCVHNDLTIFKTVKLKFDSNLKTMNCGSIINLNGPIEERNKEKTT